MAYLIHIAPVPERVHWTARGVNEATLYLAIFGGVIGYSAYVLMMDKLPVAVATIYTYVNLLVAVLQTNWLLYHRRFGPHGERGGNGDYFSRRRWSGRRIT